MKEKAEGAKITYNLQEFITGRMVVPFIGLGLPASGNSSLKGKRTQLWRRLENILQEIPPPNIIF